MKQFLRPVPRRTAAIIAVLCALLCAESRNLYADDPGPLATKGDRQCGINLGYGYSFASNRDIRYASAHPYLGWVLTDPAGSGLWRGTLEGVVEGAFSYVFKDQNTYAAGFNGLARYNFLPHSARLRPYVQAGLGVVLTNLVMDDFGSDFNFVSSAGCGLHYFYSPQDAVNIEWRVLHMSNAGLDDENDGLNMNNFFIGFSHRF
jgi:hypothetical protein